MVGHISCNGRWYMQKKDIDSLCMPLYDSICFTNACDWSPCYYNTVTIRHFSITIIDYHLITKLFLAQWKLEVGIFTHLTIQYDYNMILGYVAISAICNWFIVYYEISPVQLTSKQYKPLKVESCISTMPDKASLSANVSVFLYSPQYKNTKTS